MKRINLAPDENSSSPKIKDTNKILRKLLPITVVVGILLTIAVFISSISTSSSVVSYIMSGTSLDSAEKRINILLLGMAGGKHDGARLTDTILVASYNLKNNKLHLISIPRDLWIPETRTKVNALYQKGLEAGDGLTLSKTVIGNIVGLPIQYAFRIDFGGFVKAIDVLGGVEVEVERTFDDYVYPIAGMEDDLCDLVEEERELTSEQALELGVEPGKRKVFVMPDGKIVPPKELEEDKGAKYFNCRYEHLHFEKGVMQMDGELALKFVRSRHGTNGEGSDFARSARQEKVIQSIRNKILSLETLTNFQKMSDLVQDLQSSLDTDISIKDAIEFFKISRKLEQTYSIALDNSQRVGLPDGRRSLLVQPPAANYNGAYVLISEDDDFSIIHEYIESTMEVNEGDHEATTSARTR